MTSVTFIVYLNSRSSAIFRDLSYVRRYSCYRKDLGVYFHIIEIENYIYDIINTATLTAILQIKTISTPKRQYSLWGLEQGYHIPFL